MMNWVENCANWKKYPVNVGVKALIPMRMDRYCYTLASDGCWMLSILLVGLQHG